MNRRELLGSAAAAALLPALGQAALPAARDGSFELVLSLGAAQSGTGNHRWAQIADGLLRAGSVQGRVRSGRVDWQVDPASGAVEAAATCRVLRTDGKLVELRRGALGATRLDNGLVVLRAFETG